MPDAKPAALPADPESPPEAAPDQPPSLPIARLRAAGPGFLALVWRSWIIRLVIKLLVGWYILLWLYHLLVGLVGPFAPLLSAFGLLTISAIAGPWLIVRYQATLKRLLDQAIRSASSHYQATG